VGPQPLPLRGCEGEDEQKPMGSGLSDGVYTMGGLVVAIPQLPWRLLAAKGSLTAL
jgi:hypothetical protein